MKGAVRKSVFASDCSMPEPLFSSMLASGNHRVLRQEFRDVPINARAHDER